MSSLEETTIFQESLVRITNLRALIGTTAYTVADIKSIRVTRQEKSRQPLKLVIIGVLLILWSVLDQTVQFFPLFTLGVILSGLGLTIFILNKPYYVLQIRDAAKEHTILSATDPLFLQRIVEAMNRAMGLK